MEQRGSERHMKLVRRTGAEREAAEKRRLAPMMRALKAIHSAGSAESMAPEDLERERRSQQILGRLAAPMLGLSWEEFDLGGIRAAWARSGHGRDRRRAILYCHGGGYTSGNLGYSRPLAAKLANVTGWDVLSFEYRLAPEHPYPAALEDTVRAWDHLMYLGYGARDVTVAGDSAGGNLALALCLRLRQQARRLPARLILMSPWTDMTASGRSYTERAAMDPMLTVDYIRAVRETYAPGADWSDPLLSPLFADLTGFPPTLIQVGTNELLYSDSVRLRDRMVAAQVPCRLEVWSDVWHVFQMFPIRKAAQAMESVGRFLLEDY